MLSKDKQRLLQRGRDARCKDALRGHSSSTLQEDITIATSTCLSERRLTAHAQQVHYVIASIANIRRDCHNLKLLGDFIRADDRASLIIVISW